MDGAEVIAVLGVIAGVLIVTLPLVRALADRIRPHALDAGLKEELLALREDILAEMQQTRREIADLGERVDFQERLLAKRIER
jgi:hypothetical protein